MCFRPNPCYLQVSCCKIRYQHPLFCINTKFLFIHLHFTTVQHTFLNLIFYKNELASLRMLKQKISIASIVKWSNIIPKKLDMFHYIKKTNYNIYK